MLPSSYLKFDGSSTHSSHRVPRRATVLPMAANVRHGIHHYPGAPATAGRQSLKALQALAMLALSIGSTLAVTKPKGAQVRQK